MDPNKLFILQKNSLIDKSQKLHTFIRNDMSINIGNRDFMAKPIGQAAKYQLKLMDKDLYIVKNNKKVDLVKYQNTEEFIEISCFYLLYDDLLCSVIPCNDVNQLLCYTNNVICFKKIMACLHQKINTIFHINFNIRELPKPKIDQDVKTPNPPAKASNLIPLNDVKMLTSDNFQWLEIITTNSHNIPKYLKSRVYQYQGYYTEPSILYLKYIIEMYDKLPSKVCFLKQTPIQYYQEESKSQTINVEDYLIGQTIDLTDMRINLTGDRIRYKDGNSWGKWYNYKTNQASKITQQIFWAHIIKIVPTNSYIQYSSSNTRMVTNTLIRKYPLTFYQNIYDKYIQSKTYAPEYLDRAWDSIF